MKTDSLFYELFRRLPTLPFELLGEDPGRAGEYRFDSIEIKQPGFRIDGVLLPDKDSPGHWIYFLEVQFQKNRKFYPHLFAEVFLYLEQKMPRSNWRAAAFFARKGLDPGLPIQYEMLRSHLSVVYLDDRASGQELTPALSLVQMIVAPKKQAVRTVRRLRRRMDEEPGKAGVSREIMELMETILIYKFPKMSREELETMFQLEDIRKSVVYQEALREGKLEGEREGEIKGEIKGKREGKLETVPLLLKSGLSVEIIAKELRLDADAVREAATKSQKRKRKASEEQRVVS